MRHTLFLLTGIVIVAGAGVASVAAGTLGAIDSVGPGAVSRAGSLGCTTTGGDGSGVCSTPIGALNKGSVTAAPGPVPAGLLGGAVSLTGGAGMPVGGGGGTRGASTA